MNICGFRLRRINVLIFLLFLSLGLTSCSKKPGGGTGEDSQVTTLGSVEVTAELVEIRGDLIDDPMYDYVHVMKYKVLQVHRGQVDVEYIYVGHYNPAKARSDAADARVPKIGGTVTSFNVGDVHRMALEVPIDDYFMGGVINKYFGEIDDPVYWAVWTNTVFR